MSTYFTSRPHPQYGHKVDADSYPYMEEWHSSILHLGLEGLIFHDGLSPEFVSEWTTPDLHFQAVDPRTFRYPLNDQRFLVYRQFLRNHPEIEKVFLTDLSDVRVARDPFPEVKPGLIYVGSQPGSLWPRVGDGCKYVAERLVAAGEPYSHWIDQLAPVDGEASQPKHPIPVLNAGILGGCREMVLTVLDAIVQCIDSIDRREENLNMGIFNYVHYRFFAANLVTGAPVHSVFGGFENERTDVWFIHK